MRVKYNEEGLREELRLALMVVPRTRGQLEGFETNGCSNWNFTKVASREILSEDGDYKLASIKSDVVTTLPCKTFKNSPIPLPHKAFMYSKLIRDMNSNSEHISNWLRYCYSEGAQIPTSFLLQTLLNEFYKEEPNSLSSESKELIKHLALLACQQKRDALNSCRNQLTQKRIAECSGKKQKAWEKSWAKRWNRLLQILSQFDKEGLDHVHECRIRRKTTRRHADMPMQQVLRAGAREYVATRMAV